MKFDLVNIWKTEHLILYEFVSLSVMVTNTLLNAQDYLVIFFETDELLH